MINFKAVVTLTLLGCFSFAFETATGKGEEARQEEFNEICHRGQFVSLEDKKCKPCPPDTYMPDIKHSQIRCHPHYHAHPNSPEIDLTPGTPTTDTVIGCKEGYFLLLAALNNDKFVKCYPCTNCKKTNPLSYEIRPCGESVDTVCCPHPDMKAVQKVGEYAYECQINSPAPVNDVSKEGQFAPYPLRDTKIFHSQDHFSYEPPQERPPYNFRDSSISSITCGAGQFLKVDDVTKREKCEPCPNGTFIPDESHTQTKCFPCKLNTSDGSVTECISEKLYPVIKSCPKGKYLYFPAAKATYLRECKRCTLCIYDSDAPYVGRPCTNTDDAKCCPKENMVFQDGTCTEKIKPTLPTFSDASTHENENKGNKETISKTPYSAENVSTPSPVRHVNNETKWFTAFVIVTPILSFVIVLLAISHCPCVNSRIERVCRHWGKNENMRVQRDGNYGGGEANIFLQDRIRE